MRSLNYLYAVLRDHCCYTTATIHVHNGMWNCEIMKWHNGTFCTKKSRDDKSRSQPVSSSMECISNEFDRSAKREKNYSNQMNHLKLSMLTLVLISFSLFLFPLFLFLLCCNAVTAERCNNPISTKATDQYTGSSGQWTSVHNTRQLCPSTGGLYGFHFISIQCILLSIIVILHNFVLHSSLFVFLFSKRIFFNWIFYC